MAIEWVYSMENVDWEELSRLYLIAPLAGCRKTCLIAKRPISTE